MILNPTRIIKDGIIGNIQNLEEQVQSNGIDLTLKEISVISISKSDHNVLTLKERSHVKREKIEFGEDGRIMLLPGIYDILFNEKIEIPNGLCANIHTRSTVNRGGNFVSAGLYDAGYKGVLGAMLFVHVPLLIEKGIRLAQITFSEAEIGETYDGIYNEKTVA